MSQRLRLWERAAIVAGILKILQFYGALARSVPIERNDLTNVPEPVPCPSTTTRKEWRKLTREQRIDWIDAVKCLATTPHHDGEYTWEQTDQGYRLRPSNSLYDEFAFGHDKQANVSHTNPYFLPFHRHILFLFEQKLRTRCGFEGPLPYWDWSQGAENSAWKHASDITTSPIFDPDPLAGLGGNGDCSLLSDCAVTTGAFASDTSFALSNPVPHPLRRKLAPAGDGWEKFHRTVLQPDAIAQLKTNTTPGDYWVFQNTLTDMHNIIHGAVGGDLGGMCPRPIPQERCTGGFTTNEPLFWLHHGQLDRLWSEWQKMHPDNFYALTGAPLNYKAEDTDEGFDFNTTMNHLIHFSTLGPSLPVGQTFNHDVEPYCYKYEDPL